MSHRPRNELPGPPHSPECSRPEPHRSEPHGPEALSPEALSPQERQLLADLATRVQRLGIVPFARFVLEAHRPLEFFAGQLITFGAPCLGLLVSRPKLDRLADLLSRRKAIDQLLRLLEPTF